MDECQCKKNIESLQFLILNLEILVDITQLALRKYKDSWIPYHVLQNFDEIDSILRFVNGKIDSLHYRVRKLADEIDLNLKEE